MTSAAEWAAIVIPTLVTGIGGLLWFDRKLTRLETLLMNHLAHHDEHSKITNFIIERLLPNEMARYREVQRPKTADRPGAFQG